MSSRLFLRRAVAKYPPCPPESSSTPPLRTRSNPTTQHMAYGDVYATRLPVRGLIGPHAKTRNTGRPTRTFLENKLLRATGRAMGTAPPSKPPDHGEHGFHKDQKLLTTNSSSSAAPGSPLLMAVLLVDCALGAWGAEGMRHGNAHDYEWVEEKGAAGLSAEEVRRPTRQADEGKT
ncbi:hypothetical protein LXA43DRAFT_975237 [Ganoderma leucocontextum]|nr:hypothetical protein LXA43DRAFT_975237 [Ganoderma leucocontextum]